MLRPEEHVKKSLLTAEEAAETLGVSMSTLYAYVSRGLIRSQVLDAGKRTKSYSAEDVAKLKRRKEERRNPAKAVARSLNWGTPLLDSALTLIQEHRVYYRGYDVVALAEKCSFEQVAALLWTGRLSRVLPRFFREEPTVPANFRAIQSRLEGLSPVERFQVLLPMASAADDAAYYLQPRGLHRTGAGILSMFTAVACDGETGEGGFAKRLAAAWSPSRPEAEAVIEQALILCADHELNVSSFTARCVASARANLYQAVQAGLAAIQGARHGRETERVAAFLREVGKPERARQAVMDRLRRDETVPGFGHPLYPDGDPRAKRLLSIVRDVAGSSALALIDAVNEAVADLLGEYPTLDMGLVALVEGLSLDTGKALTLFALGRSVGWIGQALETYESGNFIRPRARYTGEAPRALPDL